jgi:transcriptional regulator with XRE-family HTH domain
MSLQEKVRALRENLGYNQIELAQKAGITAATVSRIESGKTKQLKSNALSRLALSLNVSTDDLISNRKSNLKFDPVDHDPKLKPLLALYRKLTPEKRKQLICYTIFLTHEADILNNYKHMDLIDHLKG